MSTYRLVASDLDGTLLRNDQTLSPENAAAIAEMARRGVQFAISTGRTYGEILPALRKDPDIRFVIHSDGAVIYDKQTDTRHTVCFSGEAQRGRGWSALFCRWLFRQGREFPSGY